MNDGVINRGVSAGRSMLLPGRAVGDAPPNH